MVTHLSTRETQFSYFDRQLEHPVWKGRKILDFGGNVGGFLAGADEQVDHDDYWCLDLTRGAVEQGGRRFPRAHFVHYNRYSSYFNSDGVRYLPIPDLGLKFDLILAFSVFTHTHRSEMLELVGQLRGMLSPRGVLAFTYCEPSYDRSLSSPELPSGTDVRKMLEWEQAKNPSLEIEGMVETARQANWCLLIDDKLYVEPGDELCQQERSGQAGESYCTYFSTDYMASLFPDATMLSPVSPEWQHCCIIRNERA
ncbi:MAG TPA: class I SAM-dependent methyltransferase [Pyrinomonadaceae bacterium]